MLTTTHYGLNIVEGTDVVNPLVQQNPNYTAIDAAMFANKQAVIGTGTELTAGTVHTITRANTDSNYVRFTATSNWTAGDSMVIDSTPVSVYLSDGTTPATGAYIINTEVLLLVNGSRVTLITSGYKEALDMATTADGKADTALANTTVQTVTITPNADVTLMSGNIRKFGGIRILSARFSVSANLGTYTQLFTFSENGSAEGDICDNSDQKSIACAVTSGSLQNRSALTAGHTYSVNIVF